MKIPEKTNERLRFLATVLDEPKTFPALSGRGGAEHGYGVPDPA
jgi:hypothetical protein